MPYSAEHKQQTREKILQSAIESFSRQGFENTSIDEVMANAEMTRGAFYAHFSSKSELYQQAILTGAMNSKLVKQKPEDIDDQQWVQQLVKGYLSIDHVKQKSGACPLAFLVTDVAVSEPEVRHTYTQVFQNMNKRITRSISQFSDSNEEDVFAAMAMMIGGVAIGRSLDSKTTLDKLLVSCEAAVLNLLNGNQPKS